MEEPNMKEDNYGHWYIDQNEIIQGLIESLNEDKPSKNHIHSPYTDGCDWYCIANNCSDRMMGRE